VSQRIARLQRHLQRRGVGRAPGHDGDDGGKMPGPDAPDMEIGHPVAVLGFDLGPDALGKVAARLHVEQDAAGIAHQSDRPVQDDGCADQPHQRIQPDRAEPQAGHQRDDREHGGQGIRHHMHECGADIVIGVMRMMMSVAVVVIMPVPRPQHGRADEINDEAQDRHQDRLVERDR